MLDTQEWNSQVDHPLQSYEWGEFRELTGVKVVRESGLQITIHRVPRTQFSVGYLPKGPLPTPEQVAILHKVAKEHNCLFIKVEPKVEKNDAPTDLATLGFVPGRSLFTPFNFVLDVTPSIEELSAAFKQKTRYNIRVAEKRGVTVEIDNSEAAFEKYLSLTEETTKRQGFYAHSREYHKKMWSILHPAGIAQLLVAKYNGEIITTWVLFKFNDTLYYPYGASTREHREVMANNLVMFTAIKLAKDWGLKYLDMWGALGPEPDSKDPWFGFHTFKSGYGARHVEYVGTWDYVAKPWLYKCYRAGESLRWWFLRMRKK
jgi:lipid II:glycine glycyltransferase (peptidoglycan interpeptide bridge formation enzyme)